MDTVDDAEDRDWRQIGTYLLAIHRRIGSKPMLVIGLVALLRLYTYTIFDSDGLVEARSGVVERPITHTMPLLGGQRAAEDLHHVRLQSVVGFRVCITTSID